MHLNCKSSQIQNEGIKMNNQPMTMDQLRARVPSAFATEAHESRSDRYTYIPTSNVIEGMMQSGFQVFNAVESRYRDAGKAGFTKHMLRFRQPGTIAIVGDSFLEVVLVNAHDGSSTYQLFGGIFRFTCAQWRLRFRRHAGIHQSAPQWQRNS
jgi:hypothetical protein